MFRIAVDEGVSVGL